ncbi:phenylalanine--tRNA ligase subunit alpha [Candidatus Woesearchaeota archaeon]|nr:phenylalanine--tRNA ligase subunit alpha [Candidatus Woesearchaeota archaeon]
MADIKKLIDTLHLLERKVLPVLGSYKTLPEIVSATGLKEVEVMRALQWLENKKIVRISTELKEVASLDKNGLRYVKSGLPERLFVNALKARELSISRLEKITKLSKDELNSCLGILRKKAMVVIIKNKELRVKLTDEGLKWLKKEFLEEKFLKNVFPLDIKSLQPEEQFALQNLKKRKNIIRVEMQKLKHVKLLAKGNDILSQGLGDDKVIDVLRPELLRSGEWRNKSFRRYDVSINVPKIWPGKKQTYRIFLDDVRKKFLSLGFSEMTGPLVESEFWNMDSLFMPQFHSARDIHDALYVKEPKRAKLDEALVKRVKAAHENGFGTGSKGWDYEFDTARTHRLVLRSQGTACSARMLASDDLKIPGKYFGITRCFRKDVVDATHNADFYQIEGIVIEKGLTLSHLFGLLRMFAREFAGADEVKIVPGYFPFTEPSVELFARHPEMGWIELGGAGIFRPELVKPLTGKDISVIAWGIGIDRIAMFKLGIKDIRCLFSHDLEFLRNQKVIGCLQ